METNSDFKFLLKTNHFNVYFSAVIEEPVIDDALLLDDSTSASPCATPATFVNDDILSVHSPFSIPPATPPQIELPTVPVSQESGSSHVAPVSAVSQVSVPTRASPALVSQVPVSTHATPVLVRPVIQPSESSTAQEVNRVTVTQLTQGTPASAQVSVSASMAPTSHSVTVTPIPTPPQFRPPSLPSSSRSTTPDLSLTLMSVNRSSPALSEQSDNSSSGLETPVLRSGSNTPPTDQLSRDLGLKIPVSEVDPSIFPKSFPKVQKPKSSVSPSLIQNYQLKEYCFNSKTIVPAPADDRDQQVPDTDWEREHGAVLRNLPCCCPEIGQPDCGGAPTGHNWLKHCCNFGGSGSGNLFHNHGRNRDSTAGTRTGTSDIGATAAAK